MKPKKTVLVRRHAVVTRLTHWINAFCLGFLLLSGLQIFNAWPNLYWGQYGADRDGPSLSIASTGEGGASARLRAHRGRSRSRPPGVLGVSRSTESRSERAFPTWLTLPSYQDLAAGRRWHFFFAWCFVINGCDLPGLYGLSRAAICAATWCPAAPSWRRATSAGDRRPCAPAFSQGRKRRSATTCCRNSATSP
jgi:hypothetical protein